MPAIPGSSCAPRGRSTAPALQGSAWAPSGDRCVAMNPGTSNLRGIARRRGRFGETRAGLPTSPRKPVRAPTGRTVARAWSKQSSPSCRVRLRAGHRNSSRKRVAPTACGSPRYLAAANGACMRSEPLARYRAHGSTRAKVPPDLRRRSERSRVSSFDMRAGIKRHKTWRGTREEPREPARWRRRPLPAALRGGRSAGCIHGQPVPIFR